MAPASARLLRVGESAVPPEEIIWTRDLLNRYYDAAGQLLKNLVDANRAPAEGTLAVQLYVVGSLEVACPFVIGDSDSVRNG